MSRGDCPWVKSCSTASRVGNQSKEKGRAACQATALCFYNSARKQAAQLVSCCTDMFSTLSGNAWVFRIPLPCPSCRSGSQQTGWDRGGANGAAVRQSGWEHFVLFLPLTTAPPREGKTFSGLWGQQPAGSGASSPLPALLQLLAGGKWEPTFPSRALELPVALLWLPQAGRWLCSTLPVQLLCSVMFTRLFVRHK